MSLFHKETVYALRGLVYIQSQNLEGQKPGVAEIAREIDAPPFFTAKILQRLVRKGFLSSAKGKGGGFFFEENQPALALKDLIINIEGEKIFTGCGFGLKECDPKHPCPLHDQYAPVRESIDLIMSRATIQSLATQ